MHYAISLINRCDKNDRLIQAGDILDHLKNVSANLDTTVTGFDRLYKWLGRKLPDKTESLRLFSPDIQNTIKTIMKQLGRCSRLADKLYQDINTLHDQLGYPTIRGSQQELIQLDDKMETLEYYRSQLFGFRNGLLNMMDKIVLLGGGRQYTPGSSVW